jgi:hypothetical protein
MKKKCLNCKLVNFADSNECIRCHSELIEVLTSTGQKKSLFSKVIKRATIFVFVCIFSILGFYLSMIFTSKPLSFDEKQIVNKAIAILDEKGFSNEVFKLNYLTSFRGNDHWLNASVEKESAYASTNFPFEIMTIYPDFFRFSADDTERAAILLHEAKHLEGKDEKEAYKFVWENRQKLGWTKETYSNSAVWQSVRKLTKEYAPELFVCDFNNFGDCTEN